MCKKHCGKPPSHCRGIVVLSCCHVFGGQAASSRRARVVGQDSLAVALHFKVDGPYRCALGMFLFFFWSEPCKREQTVKKCVKAPMLCNWACGDGVHYHQTTASGKLGPLYCDYIALSRGSGFGIVEPMQGVRRRDLHSGCKQP